MSDHPLKHVGIGLLRGALIVGPALVLVIVYQDEIIRWLGLV